MTKTSRKQLKLAREPRLHYSGSGVQPIELYIYATRAGDEPFNVWLDSLDGSVRAKVEVRIDRLEQGNFGNAKALKDGLFELKFKSPAFRIYYAEIGKNIVLLISGGDKSSQSDDIQRAKIFLADYRSRHGSKTKP